MNSTLIAEKIKKLQEDQLPFFGQMSPQHMIEHLTITVKLSAGKVAFPAFTPSEQQLEWKRMLLETDMEFPLGAKIPNDSGKLPDLHYPNLDEAKKKLLESLEEYHEKYAESPDFQAIHPRFGFLNHTEWDIFHQKHFKHHLTQFGIW